MEKRLSEIYSEHGLRMMLNEEHEDIKKLEKEYEGVCEGRLYNPLCAEFWKTSISKGIQDKKESIEEIIEALKEIGVDVSAQESNNESQLSLNEEGK